MNNKTLIWIVRIVLILVFVFFLRWIFTLNGILSFFIGLFIGAFITIAILYKYASQSRMVLDVIGKWVSKK